jgi:hypothetical protein
MELLEVAVPDHFNENQEMGEIPNVDAPLILIYDAHNYRR